MPYVAAGLASLSLVASLPVPASGPDEAAVPAASPAAWWERADKPVREVEDPLANRRAGRDGFKPFPAVEAIEASYHRLWGLPPLQAQIVRPGESVIEVWVRPEGGQRQAVLRVVSRSDGRGFLQARAGVACCRPEISRRVDVDRELEPGWAAKIAGLAKDAAWDQLEEVYIDEGGGALEPVCVGGVSYDLYLLTSVRAVHLRRDCGGPEVGSVAAILEPVIGASLGRDPRLDLLFPRGADLGPQKASFADLLATGGRLAAPIRR